MKILLECIHALVAQKMDHDDLSSMCRANTVTVVYARIISHLDAYTWYTFFDIYPICFITCPHIRVQLPFRAQTIRQLFCFQLDLPPSSLSLCVSPHSALALLI